MKYRISNLQLFYMMALTTLAGGTLFYIASVLKQDAWLAVLFGLPVGILNILLYTVLFSKYPTDTIITYMPKIFGKILGSLISVIFIIRFTYLAGRLTRDTVGITMTSIMPNLPLYAVTLLIMLPVLVSIFLGIENFFRIGEIAFFTFITTLFLQYIFILFTKDTTDFSNLQPILENGVMPIIKKALYDVLIFPYSAGLVFAMFFPFLNKPLTVHKTVISATILAGLILVLNTILIISVLGVEFASASVFPFLESIRHVKIGFIDRIDIFVIAMIVMGGFIKITVTTFASVIGITQLFNLKSEPKWLCVLIWIMIYFISIFSGPNYLMHQYIGFNITTIYVFNIIVIIPIIALIVHYVKKWLHILPKN